VNDFACRLPAADVRQKIFNAEYACMLHHAACAAAAKRAAWLALPPFIAVCCVLVRAGWQLAVFVFVPGM